MNIILVNKKELMRIVLDMDFVEVPQHLLNTYEKELTESQIKLIESYIELMEDEDNDFLDSDEQENMLDEIYSYFGITQEDWELLEI